MISLTPPQRTGIKKKRISSSEMATLNDARLLEAAAETEALELDALAMHVAWQEDNDRHRKETQPGMLDLV